jgi:hypothetical protein
VLGNTIFANGYQGIYDNHGAADTGFGNNTLAHNAQGSVQVYAVIPLQPNVCNPGPC